MDAQPLLERGEALEVLPCEIRQSYRLAIHPRVLRHHKGSVQVLGIRGGRQGGTSDVSHTEGLQGLLPSQAGAVHPSASEASQTDECFCR